MRKYWMFPVLLLAACSTHDPILPGTRTAVFNTGTIAVQNVTVENLAETMVNPTSDDCPYTQDSSNIIRDGETKIFTGFPTSNSVQSSQSPVCSGGFVYAGLTTGELVKINPKNRRIEWITDVFSPSNMTGGASTLDIIAPIIISGDTIYVGGLGDAFCRVNARDGAKKWCLPFGVANEFIVGDNVIFVVGTDKNLYAVAPAKGTVFWRTPVARVSAPSYANGVISVGKEKFNAATGVVIK